ncbi:hypothetical protein [Planctomicrobium sp. SH527]|uniref:hypothetical protein n=1 Tax=Planctomicrobium sp. SH527 TaxID=3448123 RepID=UPI003F5C8023
MGINNSVLTKWESTTPLSFLEAEIFANAEQEFSRCYEAAWITSVISRLEKYRIENGHYPEQLEDVQWPDWDLINPYEFQYKPHGLSYPLVLSPRFVIPAGQPIIFKARGIRPGGRDLTVNLRSTFRDSDKALENLLELIESKKILFANPRFQYTTGWLSTWEVLSRTLKNMPEKTERIQNLHTLPPPGE